MSLPPILIISPINKGGGVALDVGYLAFMLKSRFQVKIISVDRFYPDSEVYYFDDQIDYNSLDRILLRNDFSTRQAANLLSLIKPIDGKKYNRLSNPWFKKYLKIENKRTELIKNLIKPFQHILLCNQLNGKYVEELCRAASTQTIFMRITGQILPHQITEENKIWLSKIHTFIHHSDINRRLLKRAVPGSAHYLVDQSAYDEDRFLTIPTTSKIRRFFTVSRLHELKQIDKVIRTFKKINDTTINLNIYGDGPQKTALENLACGDDRITFHSYLSFKKIQKAYAENDCLIISSRIEAGPYTGIEAMAAGKPILSTRVGAMPERLGRDYPYFVALEKEDLKSRILKLSAMESEKVKELSISLREKYISNYSEMEIAKAYHDIFLSW